MTAVKLADDFTGVDQKFPIDWFKVLLLGEKKL